MRVRRGHGKLTDMNGRTGTRLRWIAPVLVLALGGWDPLWRQDPDVADGNRAYADKRYEDAVAAYERAKESGVDPRALEYDLGTAKIGQAEATADEATRAATYEEAMGHLADAAESTDPSLRARAHYNRGNVLMKQKKLEDAIAAYKDSLRADPNLESARVNLELALRHRERQRQQQQQQQGQGQGQQGQGQGQPQQGQQGQGQGQGQQGQPSDPSNPQAQGQQGQGQQGEGDQPQPPQGQGGDQQQPQPSPGQQGQAPSPGDPSDQQGGGQQGQRGQQGQPGPADQQGQGTPTPQPRWPHDDTESDTPDTPRDTKLEQLEEMSRQQRRDQVRRKSGGDHRWQQEKDW